MPEKLVSNGTLNTLIRPKKIIDVAGNPTDPSFFIPTLIFCDLGSTINPSCLFDVLGRPYIFSSLLYV